MNSYKAYPSAKLIPYIKYYWGIETVFNGNNPYLHRIIPTGIPELIFYLEHRPDTTKERIFEGAGILNIQQNDYYDLIISQNLNIFSVYFRPEAISLFFDMPLGQFFNNGAVLSQFKSNLMGELQEKLENTKLFEKRVDILESFLIKRLTGMHEGIDYRRMRYLINLISRSKGLIGIDRLIYESCLSRKQFERKFMNQIGISPKQYMKVIRFQSTLYDHSIYPDKSLTALAYDNGYYDQSHFINDFKIFTGQSPRKVFGEYCIISDFFNS